MDLTFQFQCNIVLYSIGLYFHHQTHPQLGVVSTLAQLLHSSWSYFSADTNKASGHNGIPVKLFQILKDDAVKVLHSICQQTWKTQQWPQDWKRSLFIPIHLSLLIPRMSKFTLAISCLTTSNLPGFTDLTF